MTSVLGRSGGRWAGLAIAVLALAGASPASAAISSTPDQTFVTNGEGDAVVRAGDKIYLGGDFSQVGPRTGPWGAVSASSGQIDTAMPQAAGGAAEVRATVSDGAGGFFVGGDFTHVGTV